LKSSLKYFIAKKEYQKNEQAKQDGLDVLPQDLDYVPSKEDLR